MKTKAPVLASLMTFSLLAAPAVHAGDEGPVKSASVDLNGDGKPEALSLEWDEGKDQFVLKAGNATLRGKTDGNEPAGFTVVDIDSGDKRKEVAVHTGETDQDKQEHLFAFDGKGLKALGSVPALTEARGNGIILSDSWQGFWNRRVKYVLDARAGKVTEVPQEMYAVGVEATVKVSFPLARSRTEKTPVATLAQGSRIQVLAAAPVGRGYLFLVKSSTGLLGWADEKSLVEKTEGLPLAG
ncbi:VCBS repeat-containing protein [Myxococcus sp. RHSTA-1-4]|uniref:FG-GAP repeat domain-containing protein n=1 Tax=Myxococcus sp. RHSTA-1-4 TaxID=2874601 RepID=UPI001CBF8DDB|nr:VCBS repeat-containing protein [Myxococcus sp. RHSTA-1-4]MBZ4417598.1 VCBS repeat-containing protein [Myxococcus sp. RHSTA-1-4]